MVFLKLVLCDMLVPELCIHLIDLQFTYITTTSADVTINKHGELQHNWLIVKADI